MKKQIRKLKSALNENGQGAIEYILLLVVVVAIAIAFKQPIVDAVTAKVNDVQGKIQSF